jgi:hypothetical protein
LAPRAGRVSHAKQEPTAYVEVLMMVDGRGREEI